MLGLSGLVPVRGRPEILEVERVVTGEALLVVAEVAGVPVHLDVVLPVVVMATPGVQVAEAEAVMAALLSQVAPPQVAQVLEAEEEAEEYAFVTAARRLIIGSL